jgi:hypothetical protein
MKFPYTKPTRVAIIALALLALGLASAAAPRGFVPLVEGDDPRQFVLVGIGPEAIKVAGGEIRLSGRPHGYFATKRSYKNYVLRFEWMYERPQGLESDAQFDGNSGLLVHIAGPHKVWPKCIEVQLMNADAGDIFALGGRFRGRPDAEARARAMKPVGQWNQQEVTARDATIVCKINAVEVARGDGAVPDSGQIGWQSEGCPIRFRNLMIQPLD